MRITRVAGYLVIILVSIGALFPIVWMALTSLKSPIDIIARPPKLFFEPTLANYRDLLSSDVDFSRTFVNSLIVTLVSTVVSIVLAAPAAYALSRLRPRGHSALGLTILAMRMLPPIALVVPLYIVSARLQILDTRTALILPYIALNIPLATWMLQSFFLDLPKSLEEAALLDGCSHFRAFVEIILPLAGPGIASVSIFSFVLAWNDLVIALPLTSFDATTLPVLASRVRAEEGVQWGSLGAIITVITLPVVLFTVLVQKWLVRGLTAGAVK